MAWTLDYSDEAKAALRAMDKPVAKQISKFLQRVLALPNPRMIGEPLSGPLGDYWRYRTGDYRLICSLEDDRLVVMVVKIGHRSNVYKRR